MTKPTKRAYSSYSSNAMHLLGATIRAERKTKKMMARDASYEKLAEIIRHRFTAPKDTLKELYARMVFNILCGNTDDHARNHAAFWDGTSLTLTPAYDICPQNRAGGEATQAMYAIGRKQPLQPAYGLY